MLYYAQRVICQLVENCVAFFSYTAHQGCSRCHKMFAGSPGDMVTLASTDQIGLNETDLNI